MDRYGINSSQSENHISRDSFCDTYFFIIIIEYIKRKRSKKKAVKMHLDDIHHRLESLSSMACFTNDNDSKEVEKLKICLQR